MMRKILLFLLFMIVSQISYSDKAKTSFDVGKIKFTITRIAIDNIELTLDSKEYEKSKEKYFIICFSVENNYEGEIVQLGIHFTDSTFVMDNFSNKYINLPNMGIQTIKDRIGYCKLRPGEKVNDMLIFDIPIQKASSFVLVADIIIYQASNDNKKLGSLKKEIKFDRETVH